MKILVTGAAGFIGFHVTRALVMRGDEVLGIDNLSDYYDVSLKKARLEKLEEEDNFTFRKIDISDEDGIVKLAKENNDIEIIIHLAAQAGVRYSIENPSAYNRSNLAGQAVMLEMARNLPELKHFVFASSSSVYGGNKKIPFAVTDRTDTPVSLYAATKKSGELMAYSYSHLYKIPCTCLRFFTVYGPWGRPDMAYFSFTKNILEGKPIRVFNNGDMKRDFTYINDIVDGILSVMDKKPAGNYKIYNLGNSKSEELLDMINLLETEIGKKAELVMDDMQPGDVKETFADISESEQDFSFSPKTSIEEGLPEFVRWYKDYYKIS